MLSDKEKRKRYDTLGENWQSYGQRPQGWPGAQGGVRIDFDDLGGAGGFSEFFRTFFGGGGAPGFGGGRTGFGGAGFPGEEIPEATDAEGEVDLTLDEVLKGTTREVALAGSKRRVEVKIPPGVRDGSAGARSRARADGEPAAAREISTCGCASLRILTSSATATISRPRCACRSLPPSSEAKPRSPRSTAPSGSRFLQARRPGKFFGCAAMACPAWARRALAATCWPP